MHFNSIFNFLLTLKIFLFSFGLIRPLSVTKSNIILKTKDVNYIAELYPFIIAYIIDFSCFLPFTNFFYKFIYLLHKIVV